MKRYRIVYWFGSCKTEWFIRGYDENDALQRFIELKGDKQIVSIAETESNELN